MMMYNENYYYQQQQQDISANGATPADSYYSYNEPLCKEQQQQQQYYHQEENWGMDLDHEASCYAQYDLDMANAVAEADYQDYYYEQQEYHEDNEEDYDYEEEQCATDDDYDYQSDSLLSLVVGVQSYLTEQDSTKHDSPLYNLQYKMYTYMRQRAFELGVQF